MGNTFRWSVRASMGALVLGGVGVLALPSCGGRALVTSDGGLGSDAARASDSGPREDAAVHEDGGRPVDAAQRDAGRNGCPVTPPVMGSPCDPGSGPGSCEFGSDPHCTTTFGCGSPTGPNGPFTWMGYLEIRRATVIRRVVPLRSVLPRTGAPARSPVRAPMRKGGAAARLAKKTAAVRGWSGNASPGRCLRAAPSRVPCSAPRALRKGWSAITGGCVARP